MCIGMLGIELGHPSIGPLCMVKGCHNFEIKAKRIPIIRSLIGGVSSCLRGPMDNRRGSAGYFGNREVKCDLAGLRVP